ncbi:PREDICTED: butyrophilin subfamily 1 member A1-like [Gekko japonicus]|uniref:Butyrophilin subfamily 1 member A1-like n=1 Tax=Gekko japonicus TaxID=146911 RepID=A0ABM1JX03_GEKJA|nr:PREDICTED: butyrophilin subfamily 1 member A1-like [Gekko japonicus]
MWNIVAEFWFVFLDAMKMYDRCQPRTGSLTLDDVSVDLKWGYLELLEMSATVKGLVNYFIDILQNAYSLTRASVTLDRVSNNPHLFLSPDCKSVTWTPEPEVQYTWHRRFNRMSCVVGCQTFAIGRHFWEVGVKGLGDWAVGVARSSVKRKGLFSLCAEEGVFAVGKLEQQYKVFSIPHALLLPLDGELRWIGVSLNCFAGQVNFYDMARATRIFGFTEIGCFQEPFLPFFWLGGPAELIII